MDVSPRVPNPGAGRGTLPSIRLHIDRVVIEGAALAGTSPERLRGVLAAELASALRGIAPHMWTSGTFARLEGPALELAGGAPEALGRTIAGSVTCAITARTERT